MEAVLIVGAVCWDQKLDTAYELSPGHSRKPLALLQDGTGSGSSFLRGTPCMPNQTTEMRTSQQALDGAVDENSSTGPIHSPTRTRTWPGVQQSTSLSTTRAQQHGLFLSKCLIYEKGPAAQGISGPLLSNAFKHLTFLKALQSVCTAAEAQPPHTACCRP